MFLVIAILFISGVGLITWGLVSNGPQTMSNVVLLPQPKGKQKFRPYSLLGVLLPFSQALLEKLRLDKNLKRRLETAHVKLTPGEYFNLKLFLMGLLFLGIFIGFGKIEFGLIGLAVGYIVPDIFLNKKIAQRKEAIARILPETVDLLGLCVEAGLDFTTAVKWVLEKIPANPLLEELAFVLEEIKWGKPRIQAMKDMSRRLNISEVSSFVQTLVQAERMGTPVSEAFSILSEDTRLQRFHRGERFAMRAPIKILLPLIFFILPVIGIIIGGPIFLQFMQGNLFNGFGAGGG